MIIGNTFTYNCKSSEPYGLRFLIMNTDENKEIGGNLEYTTFKNNKSPRYSIQESNYNSVFEYEVEMISEYKLDDKIDEIYDWILNQPNFGKLIIDGNDDFYYNCVFTNASYIDGGGSEGWGIYGIKATMKCDSTFMWKDVEYTYSSTDFEDYLMHENLSQVRGYSYPTMAIKTGETGGDVLIQNLSDNYRLCSLKSTLPNDTITMSYFPTIVESYLNNNANGVYESFNKKFLRLVQGNNKITVVGDITEITLKYKIGKLVR